VKRAHDGKTAEISVLSAGGIANASAQDDFCGNSPSSSFPGSSGCVVSRVFDQSPNGNHLGVYSADHGVSATGNNKTTLNGHPVYGMYFNQGMGYRNDKTTGMPKGEEPESMYMVVGGKHFDDSCCFDYGNAETNDKDDGPGTMEAIYFG
jgi:hypothetical protein